MRCSLCLATIFALGVQAAASGSWGFSDATVSVHGKGSGVGGGTKEKLTEGRPLAKPVQLGASDSLRVILTTQEGKTGKRPHQAFLMLQDLATGLETASVLSVKENGKAKVEVTHKDIPPQLLSAASPLSASIAVASFGSSKPYLSKAFDLSIVNDPASPIPSQPKPMRYGKLPEIQHVFKDDPTSPPKVVSIFFTAVVLAAIPGLLVAWLSLGANANHLSKAVGQSPVSHVLFFGSIVAMEGIFFMYYTSWNLFQTLPAALAVGCVTFLSGSRALTEVQERRLAGLR